MPATQNARPDRGRGPAPHAVFYHADVIGARRLLGPDRPRSGRRSDRSSLLIALIGGASAIGGALATGAPTELAGVDVCYRALFAGGVTVAAVHSSRAAWILCALWATIGALLTGVPWFAVLAGASVVLVVPGNEARPLAGVATVSISVQVLLRLPDAGFATSTAVLTALATLPVLVSAFLRTPPPLSRVVRRIGFATLVIGSLLLAGFVIGGTLAWLRAGQAVDQSRMWLEIASEGDPRDGLHHLDQAAHSFDGAGRALTGWWAQPARLLPLVGRYVHAGERASIEGAELARAASDVARVADYDELRTENGRIDLEQLASVSESVDAAMAQLGSSARVLEDMPRTWLAPPVRDRLQAVTRTIDRAADSAELTDALLDVAPALLGGPTTRRYLVVFPSPAETRELGGFAGNWAELTAADGALDLTAAGRAADLNALSQDSAMRSVLDPEDYPYRYLQYEPWRNWQDLTGTPDFPTVAAAARELYPRATGRQIDGVLLVDPKALAALLGLIGPIELDGLEEPLTRENAAGFLLVEQYSRFSDKSQRVDVLDEAARKTFEKLTKADLPGPSAIADALGDVVREGRLLFWTFEDEEQAVLTRLGLDGALPSTGQRPGTDPLPESTDFLSVVTVNDNPNKIDPYLHRDVDYVVELDPKTGRTMATVKVELANRAPEGLGDYVVGNKHGLPPGTNRLLLSIYTPHRITAATVDGVAVTPDHQPEYGWHRYETPVAVPPGGTVDAHLELEGSLELSSGYELTIAGHPTVQPTRHRVETNWRERESSEPSSRTLGIHGAVSHVERSAGALEFELFGDVVISDEALQP